VLNIFRYSLQRFTLPMNPQTTPLTKEAICWPITICHLALRKFFKRSVVLRPNACSASRNAPVKIKFNGQLQVYKQLFISGSKFQQNLGLTVIFELIIWMNAATVIALFLCCKISRWYGIEGV
jgi:hypothetical protein